MFAVLEFQDFAIMAAIVALLAGGSAYATSPVFTSARINQLDRKLDAIIQHLNIELPEALVKYGLSTRVCQLADEGKKIEAIKVHREETGVGLKEGRDAVEAYLNRSR